MRLSRCIKQMRKIIGKNRCGFNLLETLLASSLLAGAVMTIGALSARSVSTVRVDQEVEKAWELADLQLTLIDAAGVAAFQEAGVHAGTFEQDERYSWEVKIEELQIDHLFSIEVIVRWSSGSGIRQVRCQTRLCDPPEEEQTEAETETEGQIQP